ncbi:hypothetical protein G7K71_18745 [Desulfofundulus sp. TPOSR]|nr:hypothetical protein [Desulfofundulus sp. TPOSR]NHM28964.1 hypothetical protein [Desulfofundulus sp. TPOSR]
MFNRWFRFALYTSLESPVFHNACHEINDLVMVKMGFLSFFSFACLYIYHLYSGVHGQNSGYMQWLILSAFACKIFLCAGLVVLWLDLLEVVQRKVFCKINGCRYPVDPYRPYREKKMLCGVVTSDDCPYCGMMPGLRLNLRGWLRGGPLIQPAVYPGPYLHYPERLWIGFFVNDPNYYKGQEGDNNKRHKKFKKYRREFLSKFVIFNPDRPGQWLSRKLVFDREEHYLTVATQRKKVCNTCGEVDNGKNLEKIPVEKVGRAHHEICNGAGGIEEKYGAGSGNIFDNTPGNVAATTEKKVRLDSNKYTSDLEKIKFVAFSAPELDTPDRKTVKPRYGKMGEFVDDDGQKDGDEQVKHYYREIIENIHHAAHSLTIWDRLLIVITFPVWFVLYLFSNRGPVRPLNAQDFKTFAFCSTGNNPFLVAMVEQSKLVVALHSFAIYHLLSGFSFFHDPLSFNNALFLIVSSGLLVICGARFGLHWNVPPKHSIPA